VVRDYYAALHHAYRTKDFERLSRFFAEDCVVTAVNESFEGKVAALQFMTNVIALIDRFEIQRQYFDHDSCCTLMKIYTRIPNTFITNIEVIVLRDNQIVELTAIFDTLTWQRYLTLIQNGDLFTAKTLALE
jgi:ketosteroid isomerase-like protein